MTETKIKSITIQVDEIELTLTPGQARELKSELDTLLGSQSAPVIPSIPYYPTWVVNDPAPLAPGPHYTDQPKLQITCNRDAGSISVRQNKI